MEAFPESWREQSLPRLKIQPSEDIIWILYNFGPISVTKNCPGIMGYWSGKELNGPHSQNFHLQLRELQFRKVTQGHTAGQLKSQFLMSGFLTLSSLLYTLLHACDGMIRSPCLSETMLILKLKISYPRKPLSPRKTRRVAHPNRDASYYSESHNLQKSNFHGSSRQKFIMH